MPNCFMEVTYQNRWKRICAVATATCFLPLQLSREVLIDHNNNSLSQKYTSFVY